MKTYDIYKVKNRKDEEPTEDGLCEKTEFLDVSKRVISHSMSQSQREVPIVGLDYEPDVTELLAQLKKFNENNKKNIKISINTLLMKLSCECLKAAPILNSSLIYNHLSSSGRIEYKEHVDISVPTLVSDGRMIPLIVKNCDTMSLTELQLHIDGLMKKLENTILEDALFDLSLKRTISFLKRGQIFSAAAKAITGFFGPNKVIKPPRKELKKYHHDCNDTNVLTKNDIGEGTISITNWGSIYKDLKGSSTIVPLIPPNVFMSAVAAVQDKQYLYKDDKGEVEIGIRKILPITLLFDHRIGGFSDMLPYVKRMDEILKEPSSLFAV